MFPTPCVSCKNNKCGIQNKIFFYVISSIFLWLFPTTKTKCSLPILKSFKLYWHKTCYLTNNLDLASIGSVLACSQKLMLFHCVHCVQSVLGKAVGNSSGFVSLLSLGTLTPAQKTSHQDLHTNTQVCFSLSPLPLIFFCFFVFYLVLKLNYVFSKINQ